MDPKDFFKTAAYLKDQQEECHIRTSISRSYYAVHLYIRHRISATFLGKKNFKNSPHKKIIQCLQFCDAHEFKGIGVMLSNLYQARLDADYEMSKTIPPNKSEDVYEDAIELLSDFEQKMGVDENKQKLAKSSIQQAKNEGILPR